MNIEINADIVSIVSAGISFLAMVITLASAVVSKRNLKLQQKIYDEGKPNYKISSIVESYAVYDDNQNIVKLMFYPLITNMSSKPMTIEKIRLHLIGEDKTMILTPLINDTYIHDGHNISANSSDTRWLCFEVDQNLYKDLKIIKYKLVVEDVYGITEAISTSWIRELVSENERTI